ncbi:syntaxin-12 [Ixodes scapularis]|uniref:syntaxin-12 n=1 Tax=Ixodes scapularis TaxID=6945 RepID=UPI001A9F7F8D|nr:syntaxin-12 [Ixodes scapularis]
MSLWNSPGGRNAQNYGSTTQGFGSAASPSRMSNPVQRFHQLSDNISSNIFSINTATSTLERATKQLGTQADTEAFRDKIHLTQQNANATIKMTSASLHDLAGLIGPADKQLRLQSDRLRNEFQEVVKRYSNLQKEVATRQRYSMCKPAAAPRTRTSGWGGLEAQREEEEAALIPGLESPQSPVQQQQHLVADLDYENALLAERERRMRQIETDMLDCNQIFKDLATLVHEQGETINSIEGNIESTQINTSQAVDQLRSAAQYQKKYRKKACCLLTLAVIGIAALALVIYFSAR